jgi:hypothetical protein
MVGMWPPRLRVGGDVSSIREHASGVRECTGQCVQQKYFCLCGNGKRCCAQFLDCVEAGLMDERTTGTSIYPESEVEARKQHVAVAVEDRYNRLCISPSGGEQRDDRS